VNYVKKKMECDRYWERKLVKRSYGKITSVSRDRILPIVGSLVRKGTHGMKTLIKYIPTPIVTPIRYFYKG